MKKKLLLLVVIVCSTSSSFGLTWKEFFDALGTYSYEFPDNASNKQVTCWKKVYWEEYVEGNSYSSGYVKTFNKEFKIDCPY